MQTTNILFPCLLINNVESYAVSLDIGKYNREPLFLYFHWNKNEIVRQIFNFQITVQFNNIRIALDSFLGNFLLLTGLLFLNIFETVL